MDRAPPRTEIILCVALTHSEGTGKKKSKKSERTVAFQRIFSQTYPCCGYALIRLPRVSHSAYQNMTPSRLLAVLATALAPTLASAAIAQLMYNENFSNGDNGRDESPTNWVAAWGEMSPPAVLDLIQIVDWYSENPGDTPTPTVGFNNLPAPDAEPLELAHLVWTPARRNALIWTEEYSFQLSRWTSFQWNDIVSTPGGDNPEATTQDTHLAIFVGGTLFLSREAVHVGEEDGVWDYVNVEKSSFAGWMSVDGAPVLLPGSAVVEGFGLFLPEGIAGNWGVDNFSIFGIPEPSTLGMIGMGAVGLLIALRRRR